jgi:hypothetical protein
MGIHIGYITHNAAFLNDEVEFVLREPTGEYDVLQLLHKDDLVLHRDGNILTSEVKPDVKHDEEVEALLNTINEAMMDGVLYCDPGVTREIEGIGIVHITQRDLTEHPRIGKFLYELPLVGPRGNVWTYEAIDGHAEHDNRFKVMKDIIDEVWPEEQERLFRERVAEQADAEEPELELEAKLEVPAVKPTQLYVPSKLMRKFRKFLGLDD